MEAAVSTPVAADAEKSAPAWVRERSSSFLERVVETALAGCSLVSIFVTVGILVVLVFEAASFFGEVSFADFFGDTTWTPGFADNQHSGVWPLVVGTLLTSAIAMAVALPFGLLAAIYLSEYAAPRTRKIIKPCLELLAGVPTIVYGFFALTVVTPALQALIPHLGGFNALS